MAIFLENPTLLQSVLAYAPLHDDAQRSLEFVRFAQVLEPGFEAAFEAARAKEVARGEITGPQLSLRVAGQLRDRASDLGNSIDPQHARAKDLWARFAPESTGR